MIADQQSESTGPDSRILEPRAAGLYTDYADKIT